MIKGFIASAVVSFGILFQIQAEETSGGRFPTRAVILPGADFQEPLNDRLIVKLTPQTFDHLDAAEKRQGILTSFHDSSVDAQVWERLKATRIEAAIHFDRMNISPKNWGDMEKYYVIYFSPTDQIARVKSELEASDFFDDVSFDARVSASAFEPNDPEFKELWGLHNIGQGLNLAPGLNGIAGIDVDAPEAWANYSKFKYPVRVAVIDSGVALHPELISSSAPENNDGNQMIRLIQGINTIDHSTNMADECGHGTHVAGTIGARGNNHSGIAGVSWNVEILAIKALSSECMGSMLSIAEGIVFAVENNAKIVNMSLGGSITIPALDDAVRLAMERGVLLVAAAGNESASTVNFPAALPDVMAVGAIESDGTLANFSNHGKELDLVAPGVNILSLSAFGPPFSYYYGSGTSMASPHVAGAAALVLSANPDLSGKDLWNILLRSAVDMGDAFQFGAGRLNLYRALQMGRACIGDFNADGVLENEDFFSYMTSYSNHDLIADTNRDGVVAADDFVDFLAAFREGCSN